MTNELHVDEPNIEDYIHETLHLFSHIREQVDKILFFSEDTSGEGARDSSAVDLLSYLRTCEYLLDNVLSELNPEDLCDDCAAETKDNSSN